MRENENLGQIDAVILVGGKGARLQSLINDRPKPLAEVAGRPFMEWLLLALRSQGVRRAVLCTGYLGEMVESHFGDGRRLDMELVYSRESIPLGTGGALRYALNQMNTDPFVVLNGDSYCRVDLLRFYDVHKSRRARATLWLVPEPDCERYGTVEIESNGAVRSFHEKSPEKREGLVSAGVYMLERALVETIPQGQMVSLEAEFYPSLIGKGLYAVVGDGPFLDIGIPEAYRMASVVLQEEFKMLDGSSTREQRLRRAQEHLRDSGALQYKVADNGLEAILTAAEVLADAFRGGHKVLLCGNGGSAADCQHMAAEFVSRLSKDLERPGLPAIALTTDTSFLTAFANDYGFEGVFERQVRALGKPGDVLIGISTSGNSPNVLRAVTAAHEMGLKTIGLLGDEGALGDLADHAIAVPSQNTQLVQEVLLCIEHVLCDLTEQTLFA